MSGFRAILPFYLLLCVASACARLRASSHAVDFIQENNGRIMPADASQVVPFLADRAVIDEGARALLAANGQPDYIAVRCNDSIFALDACIALDFIYVRTDRVIAIEDVPGHMVDKGTIPDDYLMSLSLGDRERLTDVRRHGPSLSTFSPPATLSEQAALYVYLKNDNTLSSLLVPSVGWWQLTLDGKPVGKLEHADKAVLMLKVAPGAHVLVANPSANILYGAGLRPIGLTVNAEAGRQYFVREDETTHSAFLLGAAVAAMTRGGMYITYYGVSYFIHSVFELQGRSEVRRYRAVDCECGKRATPHCGEGLLLRSCREGREATAGDGTLHDPGGEVTTTGEGPGDPAPVGR
jgi:hypothetical protein